MIPEPFLARFSGVVEQRPIAGFFQAQDDKQQALEGMRFGVFAGFQVVGKLVAGGDVRRAGQDLRHQGGCADAQLREQPAGVVHLVLLKAGRSNRARHQVERDGFGQGLWLDGENAVFKGFTLLFQLMADLQFGVLVDLLNCNV